MMELFLHCATCAMIGGVGSRLIGFVRRRRRYHEPRWHGQPVCVCQVSKTSNS